MVNSKSQLGIFNSEQREVSVLTLDDANGSKCNVRVFTETAGTSKEGLDQELVKSDNSEESSSWHLHLSDEVDNNNRLSESSSDGTYISLETPSSSSSYVKENGNISCDGVNGRNVFQDTPDMFAESQEVNCADESQETIPDEEFHEEGESSSEVGVVPELEHSQECFQRTISSDSQGVPQTLCMPEEEDSLHDLQCSQEPSQDPPVPSEDSDPPGREQLELWNTQELNIVSRRLELRRRQTRRLILTVIRKRQMAEETLDAFKKRLKRL